MKREPIDIDVANVRADPTRTDRRDAIFVWICAGVAVAFAVFILAPNPWAHG